MEGSLRPPDDPRFRLIETCLWTPQGGVQHLALHLARLARTAALFGIVPHGIKAALAGVDACGPTRLRLTVDALGTPDITQRPFIPLPKGTLWKLIISDTALRSDDPWLRVKTTQRQLYDTARARLPKRADELLFLNERGEVCEGTITNVFADLGQGLLTPPLLCGLLPGVLRQTLLENETAREAVLTPADLKNARVLYVGNSLRGLIAAELLHG